MPTLIRVFLGGIIAAALAAVATTAVTLTKHRDGVKEEKEDEDEKES